jgi:AMP nucleosidase
VLAHGYLRRDRILDELVPPDVPIPALAEVLADHQPAMRPQHREMVGDGLRVRRPDADVDEAGAPISRCCGRIAG